MPFEISQREPHLVVKLSIARHSISLQDLSANLRLTRVFVRVSLAPQYVGQSKFHDCRARSSPQSVGSINSLDCHAEFFHPVFHRFHHPPLASPTLLGQNRKRSHSGH